MSDLQIAWLKRGLPGLNNQPILSIHALTVNVGIRSVIEDLNLELFAGDQVIITGPNGCGKSTLLNAIAGVAPARIVRGTIIFDGHDITREPAYRRSIEGLSYIRQRENIFVELTVNENLRLALGGTGPEDFRKSFPDWTNNLPGKKRVGMLSGGEKQRLAWAMATLRPNRLLLADEPEAGLASDVVLPNGSLMLVSHSKRIAEKNN